MSPLTGLIFFEGFYYKYVAPTGAGSLCAPSKSVYNPVRGRILVENGAKMEKLRQERHLPLYLKTL